MDHDVLSTYVESPLVSGGGPLSDLSPSLLHGPDSGQPFLCGHQSSDNILPDPPSPTETFQS